jgi:hypothetical protein
MSKVIVLPEALAVQVRGISDATQMAFLEPLPLTDGTYFLGAEVLNDPAHAKHRAALSALPQVDLSNIAALLPKGPR